uniref:Uncharacterized protein n=1 Tax=Manihot esculenta TaxID=3983 RepID=A0A2C9VLY6_MANES
MISVCYPHYSLLSYFVIPDSKIPILGIARAEKSKHKIVFFGDKKATIFNGLIYGYGVHRSRNCKMDDH